MDGRPLYEYARNGIPLPRPIEKREVTVHSLELIEWKPTDHGYRWPEKIFSEAEKAAMNKALENVMENAMKKEDEEDVRADDGPPPAFVLSMKVSGGTYVRSIVHDLCHAVGSAGHVVTLTRSKQGRFALEPTDEECGCVPWAIFEEALRSVGEKDSEGWTRWEREVMNQIEVIG
jgi:tRNA pseudouridine55 synthase